MATASTVGAALLACSATQVGQPRRLLFGRQHGVEAFGRYAEHKCQPVHCLFHASLLSLSSAVSRFFAKKLGQKISQFVRNQLPHQFQFLAGFVTDLPVLHH